MALTPPPDGTATYGGPLTLRWDAPDPNFSTSFALPQEIVDTLSDDDMSALVAAVDHAMEERFPGVRLVRTVAWTFATPPATTTTTLQEGSDGD